MRRGEVRWAELGPVVGHEQDGRRPVLIVSDDRYMAARKLAVVFPMTTSERLRSPLAIELSLPSVVDRRCFALPGQIRTLSVRRLGRLLATVTERDLDACLDAMLLICGRRPHQRHEADNDA